MEHLFIRIYWFFGNLFIFIVVIILFSKVLKNPIKQKTVKDTFLILFVFSLLTVISDAIFYLFIERDTISLLLSFSIFIGLIFGSFEFLIMKRRLHQNIIKNTFFIPSCIFFFIISIVLPVVFLAFMDVFDFKILRWRVQHFTFSFFLGYSSILYLKFLFLERKIGTVYFEKRILGFLKSKKEKSP